ncbi:DNA-binding response OmpR family regulator [Streptomyces sp. TE12347]
MTRVLVVDDEPQLARLLVINLKARKYEVDSAQDGGAALDAVAACRPDVVLLDLGLPDMDGIDVIKNLRRSSQVPVLVVSARHGSEEKIRALDAGADDYVTKPFSMDELLARLGAVIRRTPRQGPAAAEEALVDTDEFTVDRPAAAFPVAAGLPTA